MVEQGLHRSHYGLKAPLLVLWVFSTRTNEAKFLDLLERQSERIRRHFLTQSISRLHEEFWPLNALTDLREENSNREF